MLFQVNLAAGIGEMMLTGFVENGLRNGSGNIIIVKIRIDQCFQIGTDLILKAGFQEAF